MFKSFSLVEIMLVVAIVGMLASVSVPLAELAMKNTRKDLSVDEVKKVRDALDEYKRDHGYYPKVTGTETAYNALYQLVNEGYLRNIPVNPYTGSEKDWEIRDSVNSGWMKINSVVENNSNTILSASTATKTKTPYNNSATDVFDFRFPKDLDVGNELYKK